MKLFQRGDAPRAARRFAVERSCLIRILAISELLHADERNRRLGWWREILRAEGAHVTGHGRVVRRRMSVHLGRQPSTPLAGRRAVRLIDQ